MSSSQTNPSKTTGQWHSAKGEVKKGLGSVIGSTTLKQQGQQEHVLGQAEIHEARKQGSKTEGNYETGGGGGPFSGTNLSQYDDQNLGGGMQNQACRYPGSQTSGYVGEADTAAFNNEIGSHGPLGISTGVAADRMIPADGMSQRQKPDMLGNSGFDERMGGTGTGPTGQGAGFEDRQTKQDLKEWERNAF